MKKLLLAILFFPLFSFAQETFTFDTKDLKVGESVQGKRTEYVKPIISTSPQKITLFIDSNIDYAPIGVKFMMQEDNDIGLYFTVKISEDYFTRNVTKNKDIDVDRIEKNATIFDINELIICGGLLFYVANNIDFYFGGGVMRGQKHVPYSTHINSDKTITIEEWVKTNSSTLMPMASIGIILTRNRFKFSFGNETAFAKDTDYPVGYLNEKSFARLSSFTFGVGYTLGK